MYQFPLPVRVVTAVVALTVLGGTDVLKAQKLLADAVQDLATQIASKVEQEKKRRIAVLPFLELDGRSTVLSTYLPEELVTHLFNLGTFHIVERTVIDRLLGEIKLDRSGLIDPETAKEVGKIAGVEAVVTGTIADFQTYVAVNCRLIDAQTATVFAAAQVRIAKDDDVRKILDSPIPGESAAPAPSAAAGSQPEADLAHIQEQEDFTFLLQGCSRSGTNVRCRVLITNNAGDRELIIDDSSRFFDEIGNEWKATFVKLGSKSGSGYIWTLLLSGVPTKAELLFEGVVLEARTARRLEIVCSVNREFRVQFGDVPLSTR